MHTVLATTAVRLSEYGVYHAVCWIVQNNPNEGTQALYRHCCEDLREAFSSTEASLDEVD
jgi:hypothetical protein